MEFDEYSIKSSSDLRAEAGVLLTSDKITKSKHGIAVVFFCPLCEIGQGQFFREKLEH